MLDIQSAGSGWTKSVYRVQLRGQPLAIKTVNMRGKDMMKCLGQGLRNPTPSWQATPSTSECYHQAASKIIREVAILTQLAPHDHFIPTLAASPGCTPAVTYH
ncbi:hypothetical protein LSTR_LSTR016976 [Laodelphax striatellus]|uniref:Protein kinase domain-containing protein n=1 Tax=Laodelphax striatellus TaxID=195883 RepID=A0A482WPV3_LAOST|nr:hypothetical protein LSTR_LSTR016976 [Laodelphax striatellus]